jgi:hypothetical protein
MSGCHSGSGSGSDRSLVGAENGDEVAVAADLDLPFAGTADCGLIDSGDRAAPA